MSTESSTAARAAVPAKVHPFPVNMHPHTSAVALHNAVAVWILTGQCISQLACAEASQHLEKCRGLAPKQQKARLIVSLPNTSGGGTDPNCIAVRRLRPHRSPAMTGADGLERPRIPGKRLTSARCVVFLIMNTVTDEYCYWSWMSCMHALIIGHNECFDVRHLAP